MTDDTTLKTWLKDYAGMLGHILVRPLPQGFTPEDLAKVRETRDAVRKHLEGKA